MHPALDGDIRVRDARGEELAEGAEIEGVGRGDTALLLEHVLQLLEDGVLQDGVDDEDEGGHDAGEEAQRALIADDGEQGGQGGGRSGGLCAREHLLVGLGLARRHARVDDPDGVGDEDGCAARDGAGDHRLDRGELP